MTDAWPLVALDAVVVDTETTGLDPATARVVQIGAVRLDHGRLVEAPPFQSLVDPGEPVPPEVVRIHGIDNAVLRGAPAFATAYAAFLDYAGRSILIGHNIGYDLAVLRRECGLARLGEPRHRVLDTRLLAQICFPRLAGFDLDQMASHLGLAIENRHDAAADALATARLFLALVPHLKARGVRTIAEAEEASRRLSSVLEGFQRAGWVEPIQARGGSDVALGRIDAYPYRHRVGEIMSHPPVFAAPQSTLADAVRDMSSRRISSLFVADAVPAVASDAGIITERDVMRHLAEQGADALTRPLGTAVTRPIITVSEDALLYVALGRMARHKIRHLAVTDASGRITGALSARDLLRVRATDAHMLGDAIASAPDLPMLARAWARVPDVARALVAEGVSGREIAAVVSHEIAALTRRAASDAEARLGPPPGPYAVLVLGSCGRGESLLAPDQDNAVVWADGIPEAEADAWFAKHGEIMTNLLDDVGIPKCKGLVMTTNPQWRGSLTRWRERVREWAQKNRPQDLLSVDIFFDARGVYGDAALADTLMAEAYEIAHRAPVLAKLLAAELDSWSPPVGLFGRIRTEDGRIDLKRHAVFPAVAAARCLVLRHGVVERSTPGRVAAIRRAKLGADSDLAAIDAAHGIAIDLILRQQLTDIAAGRGPSNLVDLKSLGAEDVAKLHGAFRALAPVATTVRDLLFSTANL